MIEAKVVADSVSPDGVRLTTIQARIHRFILPEITRHRVFSFSVGSSRAVPTKKIIEQVANDPAMPIFWGKNQPGMVADEEISQIEGGGGIKKWWEDVAESVATESHEMTTTLGLHKQIVNRLLEPFQWCDLIMTGTEWDNFFKLRIDYAAQPEIREAAIKIRDAMEASTPYELQPGEWHLPYVAELQYPDTGQTSLNNETLEDLQKYSAARVARVSYLNHDQSDPDVDKDLSTANRLIEDGHWSPFEHQATPTGYVSESKWPKGVTHKDSEFTCWSGNFRGWIQHRHLVN